MPARLTFDFSPSTQAQRRDAETTRVLVIANLSGDAPRTTDLTAAHLVKVDLDSFDPLIARLRPQAVVPDAPPNNQRVLSFGSLDDFHPDQLYDALAASPARVEHVERAAEQPRERPESSGSPLDQLLGGRPVEHAGSAPVRTALDQMLQTLVAPHIAAVPSAAQVHAGASTTAAISGALRSVLHAPAFQRLEASWRALRWLVFESALGEALEVYVLDATRAQVVADLQASGGELERTQLHRAIVREHVASPDARPFSLLIGDLTFAGSADDVSLLAGLGAIAAQAGGCFLGGAEPPLWGCQDLAREPERGFWSKPSAEVTERMQALRTSAVAPFIGLCMPRVIGRVPYGAKSDPVERLSFEELPDNPEHASFLWLNPAFACAQLILTGVAERGWDDGPGSALELRDLPHALYRSADGQAIKPSAEVYLDETSAAQVLAHGLMPLMSHRNRNAARLARLQSIASPAAPLAL